MRRTTDRTRRSLALLASLLFNGAWVLAVLQVRFAQAPPAPPPLELELVMEQPAPPPPPPPPPPETKKPTPKTPNRVVRAVASKPDKPVPKEQPPADPGPPVHFLDPEGEVAQGAGDLGSTPARNARPSPPARRGMHVPSDYADAVKSRIVAARLYPAEARQTFQECFVAYTVTVDRNGALLSYDIDRCGNALLDQAARTAIEQAAPFPVPPDQGAERYDIHGSLVFRLR
ncbi:MAG TPA: TonB family protein [Macromonas sp.]|nr:TonB family protein [Macromonas sp.]